MIFRQKYKKELLEENECKYFIEWQIDQLKKDYYVEDAQPLIRKK